MTEDFRKAIVYVKDRPCGFLAETENGYSFLYDPDYCELSDAQAVSLTMPLRREPYESKVLFSFFDGLIPEGWLLYTLQRNWKLDLNDRFGLLLLSCRDCIGDVSLEEINE